MKTITPWSKEAEKILERLAKDTRAYTRDINFTRILGKNYPDLLEEENGFMDIGRIERRRKSIIVLRPGVALAPLPKRGRFKKFQVFKIY